MNIWQNERDHKQYIVFKGLNSQLVVSVLLQKRTRLLFYTHLCRTLLCGWTFNLAQDITRHRETCLQDAMVIVTCQLFLYILSACVSKTDMVLLLDTSGSIGRKDFEIVRGFTKELIQTLNIGPDAIQVNMQNKNKIIHQTCIHI